MQTPPPNTLFVQHDNIRNKKLCHHGPFTNKSVHFHKVTSLSNPCITFLRSFGHRISEVIVCINIKSDTSFIEVSLNRIHHVYCHQIRQRVLCCSRSPRLRWWQHRAAGRAGRHISQGLGFKIHPDHQKFRRFPTEDQPLHKTIPSAKPKLGEMD